MPITFTSTWQSEHTAIGCASGMYESLKRWLRCRSRCRSRSRYAREAHVVQAPSQNGDARAAVSRRARMQRLFFSLIRCSETEPNYSTPLRAREGGNDSVSLPDKKGARNATRARVYARHARKTPTRRGKAAAKPAATASKQVSNTKAAPTRTPRVIAKVQTVYTLSSTRHVERKLAPSAP